MSSPHESGLVILGLPTWEGPYEKAIVQIARRIALRRRVLYVEYAPTYADVLRRLWSGRTSPRAAVERALRYDLRQASESPSPGGLYVLTPRAVLPINALAGGVTYERLRRANELAIRGSVRSACRRIGLESYDLLNAFWPHVGAGRPSGWWGERLRFYYSYDDIGGVEWNARHGVVLEEAFVRACDGVIVTSPALAARARQLHPRVELVRNGADTALFGQALEEGPVPEELDGITGPVALFVGSIDHRVDCELLSQVARLRPGYTFVLIGPVSGAPAGLDQLRFAQNVRLLGPRKPEQLPGYLRAASVCMIPFVRSRFTECIYPIKVNEYLASGRPVVCTDFASLEELGELVVQVPCGHAGLFAEALDSALAFAADPVYRQKRVAAACQADWNHRADQFANTLERWAASPAKADK